MDALPAPERLWWPFAVLAALHHDEPEPVWSFEPRPVLLTHDAHDGVRLRMQRLYGGRSVLWGTDPRATPLAGWTGIPGWATSDAVHDLLGRDRATFVAWHAHWPPWYAGNGPSLQALAAEMAQRQPG